MKALFQKAPPVDAQQAACWDVTGGDFSRTPGEPCPRDVTTLKKAREVTGTFDVATPAHEFFEELALRAHDRIEEALLQDEEFGEG